MSAARVITVVERRH